MSIWRIVMLAVVYLPGGTLAAGIRGTVHAPPQGDVHGTIVIACWAGDGECAMGSPNTRTVQITVRGSRAPFHIADLDAGVYAIIGAKDVDQDGGMGPADYLGLYSRADGAFAGVTPPAQAIELRMQILGAAMATSTTQPATASPRTARPIKGGLNGLYIGVTKSVVANGVNPAAGIFWMPSRDWNAFFPDGRVYVGFPSHGLHDIDSWWDEACERVPLFCARYTVSGNIIRVTYHEGQEKVYVRDNDGTLWHERDSYMKLAALDGLRLNGTYVASHRIDDDNPGAIVFRHNGTFVERAFLAEIGWDSVTHQPLSDEERAGAMGTYGVRGNTVELRYEDGRIIRTAVYVLPQHTKTLDHIEINGWEFLKVD